MDVRGSHRGQPATGCDADSADLWVFGYGSLMWRPGFDYAACQPALLRGYHRSFCIFCHHYRGTPETPGLVLGLDRGGACRGLVYRVAAAQAAEVTAYLHARELISDVYEPRTVPVRTDDGVRRAYTFVARRDHPQYAPDLGIERSADIIMRAAGNAGLNRDYLIHTVRHLERQGFHDRRLHALLKRIERLTGEIEAGSGI